eukprot:240444-Pelagomonas_calceolata.AAC.2
MGDTIGEDTRDKKVEGPWINRSIEPVQETRRHGTWQHCFLVLLKPSQSCTLGNKSISTHWINKATNNQPQLLSPHSQGLTREGAGRSNTERGGQVDHKVLWAQEGHRRQELRDVGCNGPAHSMVGMDQAAWRRRDTCELIREQTYPTKPVQSISRCYCEQHTTRQQPQH